MQRIIGPTVRPDLHGIGKAGFSDNADLPNQDATYLTPEWCNTIQEELCNLLELRGIALNSESKRQLYDLLTTQNDLEALATEIENNFIRKNQIVDNLTTNDSTRPASAKQVKNLQDNKLNKTDLKDASTLAKGIVQLDNTLSSTSSDKGLTALQGKVLNDQAFGVMQTWQDVILSRVMGTNYTNTTSKPITVSFAGYTAAGVSVSATVSGIVIINSSCRDSGITNSITFIVPPQATYSVRGAQGISQWAELR